MAKMNTNLQIIWICVIWKGETLLVSTAVRSGHYDYSVDRMHCRRKSWLFALWIWLFISSQEVMLSLTTLFYQSKPVSDLVSQFTSLIWHFSRWLWTTAWILFYLRYLLRFYPLHRETTFCFMSYTMGINCVTANNAPKSCSKTLKYTWNAWTGDHLVSQALNSHIIIHFFFSMLSLAVPHPTVTLALYSRKLNCRFKC